MRPACVIKKTVLKCALMLHPPQLHILALSCHSFLCVSVQTVSKGYHEVWLNPVCRVRKENFSSCDFNVKLFQSFCFNQWTIFAALCCRMWCRGNLKRIGMYRNRSLCILNSEIGNGSIRKKRNMLPESRNKQTGWQLRLKW